MNIRDAFNTTLHNVPLVPGTKIRVNGNRLEIINGARVSWTTSGEFEIVEDK